MSATDDMHAKMKLATSAEIWAPGGPVDDWTTDYDIRDDDYIENPGSDLGRDAREVPDRPHRAARWIVEPDPVRRPARSSRR